MSEPRAVATGSSGYGRRSADRQWKHITAQLDSIATAPASDANPLGWFSNGLSCLRQAWTVFSSPLRIRKHWMHCSIGRLA